MLIVRNTDKGKGKYIPPNSEDDHNALLSPQRYERPQTLTTDHILNFTSIPTSARYLSTLHSPVEIDDSPRWIKTMTSELGKVIMTMSRETEQCKEQYHKEMCDIFKEIVEQMDRCEERHQSDLHDILRMFSEENSKRECRFYVDLLNQQGRASAEINMANATNTEFLRGLQEVMLGVIVTTIQQRQGINIQGDTSCTMQMLDMQERTPGTATPAEELEETPAEPESIEEEPAPVEQPLREQHRPNWGNPRSRGRNGG